MNETNAKELSGRTWVDQVRFAFAESAGGSEKMEITREQWVKSRFRYLIAKDVQTQEQMHHHFDVMDANKDGRLTWDEIIGFMLRQENSKLLSNAKHIEIACVGPEDPSKIKSLNLSPPKDALILKDFNRFASFSDSSIIIWDVNALEPLKIFNVDGVTSICYSNELKKLIFSQKERKISFINPETNEIDELTMHGFEKVLDEKPTSLCVVPETKYFLVGYENGKINAIKIEIESNNASCELIGTINNHTKAVTKIIWIPDEKCYVSCSEDSSIVVFSVNFDEFSSKTVSQFKLPNDASVNNIVYDPVTSDIFFSTPINWFGRWRIRTSNYKLIDLEKTTISSMIVLRLSKRKSLLIAIDPDYFFMVFKQPGFISVGNWIMGDQHKGNPASVILSFEHKLYLFGAFLSKWDINLSLASTPLYQKPVGGVIICPESDAILTTDEEMDLIKWKLKNGTQEFRQQITYGAKVKTFRADDEGKKFVCGLDDGRLLILSTATCQHLTRLELGKSECGLVETILTEINGEPRLVLVNKNMIMLFNDMNDNKLDFVRNFKGHKGRIYLMNVLKHKYIVTCSEKEEIFIWQIDDGLPKMRSSIPNKVTCVADVPESSTYYLIGDDKGMVHIMAVNSPNPLTSFDAFSMNLPNTITAIDAKSYTFAVANNFGYIKTFHYDASVVETSRFRAHYKGIRKMGLISDSYLYTVGDDNRIILFALSPPRFIGAVGEGNKFDTLAPSMWRDPEEFCQQDDMQFTNSDEKIIINQSIIVREPGSESQSRAAPRRINHDQTGSVPSLDITGVMKMMNTIEDNSSDDDQSKDAQTQRTVMPSIIKSLSRNPRIARPAIKHPGLIPLFHSDGSQTVRIIEHARRIPPTNIADKKPKIERSYDGVRFNF